MNIVPFRDHHVEDAARLFAGNLHKLRQAIPVLPDRLTRVPEVESLIASITSGNPSLVAISGSRLVGYLSGWSNLKHFFGSAAGTYTPEWAHASIPGSEKAQIYHDLYTALSREWVLSRCHTHIFQFLADDHVLREAFSNYGYGLQGIDAIRSIDPLGTNQDDRSIVRQASERDLIALQEMSVELMDHLNRPPIFLNRAAQKRPVEEIKGEFLNDDRISMIAEQDGRVVSCIRGKLGAGNTEVVRAADTLAINFGYTYPAFRKSGIATQVLDHLLARGAAQGMSRCAVDFESQNKEGREFWLRTFKPVCLAAMRKIDDRIVLEEQ